MKRGDVILVCSLQLISVFVGVLITVFDKKVCMTEKCKSLAYNIIQQIDSEVNPCEDFYLHACGKLLHGNDAVPNIILNLSVTEMGKVHNILNKPPNNHKSRAFGLVKQVYNQCLNGTPQESELKILFKKLGGFPVVEGTNWNETGWTWIDTIRKQRKLGVVPNGLFTISRADNPLDTTKSILTIFGPQELPLALEQINSCGSRCQSQSLLKLIMLPILFGANENVSKSDASGVLTFALKIFSIIHVTPASLRRMSMHELTSFIKTLKNVSSSYDYIDWQETVKIMIQKEINFTDNHKVLVPDPDYLNNLKPIFESTPKRDLANFLMFQLLNQVAPATIPELRGQLCFKFISQTMLPALNAIFVSEHYDGTSSFKNLKYMFESIQQEMKSSINNSDWLDSETNREAYVKVKYMNLYLGYSKVLRNLSYIDELYVSISIKESFLLTHLSLVKLALDRDLSMCYKEVPDMRDKMISEIFPIFSPQAFYYVLYNSIYVVLGFLQEPLYGTHWPKYMNYGRVGYVLGHEITHGLDTTGSHFDKEGKFRNWWTTDSLNHFNTRAQCFIDQFSNFTVPIGEVEVNLPGGLESGENIADSGGLKLAFQAYRKYSKNLFWPELSLPGLHYTQEQLFFLSFAQTYCAKNTLEQNIQYLNYSVHAPENFRVLGSLQNNKYFSEVFGCKSDTEMNPKKKCELW